jgi:hypothetical protein
MTLQIGGTESVVGRLAELYAPSMREWHTSTVSCPINPGRLIGTFFQQELERRG